MHNYKSLFIYVGTVLFLSLGYFASPFLKQMGWEPFASLEMLAQANPVVAGVVFFLASIVFAFLAFPSMPMIYMAAGFYMGGTAGGATVLIGSALGGLGAFLFYRRHISENQSARLSGHPTWKIWITLLGLRLSPLVPAPIVNLFAAVFGVSPLQHLTTSVLGSAPLILFYVQLGEQGHHFLSGQSPQWRQFSGYVVILALSTLLSAIGPWKSLLNELKLLKGWSGVSTFSLQPAPER